MPLNGFGIYITDYSTNQTVELPVNPAEVMLKFESDDKSETIINLGEVNRLGFTKLVSISISSFFPTQARRSYLATDNLEAPDTYIDFFKTIQAKKHHVQLVISSTKISMTMTIASFEYGFKEGNADEYEYTLELKQWREYKFQTVNGTKKTNSTSQTRPAPPKKIGVGSQVVVNGRLHIDSTGRAPGQYEKNAKRTILYVAPGRTYSVCVGINGIPRGWVKQSEVKLA